MSKHKDLFNKIIDLEKKEESYAIATVFMVNGSSSGKVGDKALYDKKGVRIIGYIGGGCIENRVGATAKEAIFDEDLFLSFLLNNFLDTVFYDNHRFLK